MEKDENSMNINIKIQTSDDPEDIKRAFRAAMQCAEDVCLNKTHEWNPKVYEELVDTGALKVETKENKNVFKRLITYLRNKW